MFRRFIVQRQVAHGVQITFLEANGPEKHAGEKSEEEANGEDAEDGDSVDAVHDVFQHKS
jgi:hypothetical protein